MFGFFRGRKNAPKAGAQGAKQTKGAESSQDAPSRDEIMKQAMSNVRQARAEIGEETLNKVAEMIRRKENSEMEKAKAKIKSLDQERVADNVKAMLRDDY